MQSQRLTLPVLIGRFALLAFSSTIGSALFTAVLWWGFAAVAGNAPGVPLEGVLFFAGLLLWGAVWLLPLTLPASAVAWLGVYLGARRLRLAPHQGARLASLAAAGAALAAVAILSSSGPAVPSMDRLGAIGLALGPGVMAATLLAAWCIYRPPSATPMQTQQDDE
jgi:hypothetical protein